MIRILLSCFLLILVILAGLPLYAGESLPVPEPVPPFGTIPDTRPRGYLPLAFRDGGECEGVTAFWCEVSE